uniref:Uncharacterized protein n=1 Tax=Litopenaeus vannamei majanivirus Nimav-1_LVa TaxID=2984273 RepID=A0A9C7BH75_9VIRU|nr:MAG: hypothetical protein [Litopenaeus vannamei majanivirus Nimav-1_LVa]
MAVPQIPLDLNREFEKLAPYISSYKKKKTSTFDNANDVEPPTSRSTIAASIPDNGSTTSRVQQKHNPENCVFDISIKFPNIPVEQRNDKTWAITTLLYDLLESGDVSVSINKRKE